MPADYSIRETVPAQARDNRLLCQGAKSMNRMIVKSRVGADGILRVTLPVGRDEADREVQVTVDPVETKHPMTQDEWAAWVKAIAGSWQGDFERPPQTPLEDREPF